MTEFNTIEDICSALNKKAEKENFFAKKPEIIDKEANEFIADFAQENGLKSHTVTPSRWWLESEHKMFEDGQIELRPLVDHAVEKLHVSDKNKKIEFVSVNVKKAKLTNNNNA